MRTGAEPVPYRRVFRRADRPMEAQPDHQRIGRCVMQAALSMVVWILKREVRAIGGCLGIHRR